jgi:hypothetical protein
MNRKRGFKSPETPRTPQVRAVTAIFIILLTVTCYILARSMRQHHFTRGGRYNNQIQH